MSYLAALKARPSLHCIGVATSANVEGLYTDNSSSPYICDLHAGGAIDASGHYNAVDNTRSVVYKVDANALGHSDACNNTIAPIKSTGVMLQQVNPSDDITKIGTPIQLITNGRADGPVVEGPS